MKKMYKRAGKKMLKGGQYKLDMNKNGVLDGQDFKMLGNKKKKMMGGGLFADPKKKKKKKNMGGMQQTTPPVDSFLEPPVPQPFAQQQVMPDPNSFTAKQGGPRKKKKKMYRAGGVKTTKAHEGEHKSKIKNKKFLGGIFDPKEVRELRKKQKDARKSDKKADKDAVKKFKEDAKKRRNAKPFVDGSGPIVEMTKAEKRADRKATRKASRMFKKQERKARRTQRKADREERRNLRKKIRSDKKENLKKLTTQKLNTLNKSESSSNKPKKEEKKVVYGPKNKPVDNTKKTETKTETKKKTNHGVTDDMSFSKAFRTARNSHGGDGGIFTWKGKKYNTNLKKKEEKKKEEKKKEEKTPIKQKQRTETTPPKKKVATKKKEESLSIYEQGIVAGGYSCFSAGTLITTENGEVAIEDIKVDDMVKTYNEKTKEIEIARVDELFVHEECGDGLIINGSINTTTNHPFYIDGKWVEGKDLKLGDELLNLDGSKQVITSMELNSEPQTVYNFEVPGNHNYYAEGVLVHNKMKRGGYRRRGGIR